VVALSHPEISRDDDECVGDGREKVCKTFEMACAIVNIETLMLAVRVDHRGGRAKLREKKSKENNRPISKLNKTEKKKDVPHPASAITASHHASEVL
jgi:hypothetical protein